MTNRTYDILKYVAQIVLPATGTLYFALAAIWKLPYGEEVIGTITAVDTFLGALLHFQGKDYAELDEAEIEMLANHYTDDRRGE